MQPFHQTCKVWKDWILLENFHPSSGVHAFSSPDLWPLQLIQHCHCGQFHGIATFPFPSFWLDLQHSRWGEASSYMDQQRKNVTCSFEINAKGKQKKIAQVSQNKIVLVSSVVAVANLFMIARIIMSEVTNRVSHHPQIVRACCTMWSVYVMWQDFLGTISCGRGS